MAFMKANGLEPVHVSSRQGYVVIIPPEGIEVPGALVAECLALGLVEVVEIPETPVDAVVRRKRGGS